MRTRKKEHTLEKKNDLHNIRPKLTTIIRLIVTSQLAVEWCQRKCRAIKKNEKNNNKKNKHKKYQEYRDYEMW